MARLARYFVEGQPQHVIQRGNNRSVIFKDDRDFRFYLRCLQLAAGKHDLQIHAYVLMSNHTHLLASPAGQTSLPMTMQSVGRRYVQYFNYKYERSGTLWEGRYRATVIDSEAYLLNCMRYIELNPVRAGMTNHPDEYPWSSYACNASGKPDSLISPHFLYTQLGTDPQQREAAYRHLFKQPLAEQDLQRIRDCTNKAWVLGSETYKRRIEMFCRRRAAPQSRGRRAKPG